MRTDGALRTLLGAAALCWLLVSAGCNGVTQSNSGESVTAPRTDWGMSLSVTGGGVAGSVGPGQYPAKFTFDVTASPDCVNDFVVYNTSLPGLSGTAANIVAFNHLYATQGGNCLGVPANGTGPQVYWSYFTGTGQALTSVVLSADGTKVAFIENSSSGGATLRILKWVATEGTAAGSPHVVDHDISGSAWSTCTSGSCVVSIAFSGNAQDTNSAPFYNYNADTLYVGDNNGAVHKFTGVFNGTPAENCFTGCGVNGTKWPITVDSGKTLTGPVYDSVSNNLFVGDSAGLLSYIRESNSSVGTCAAGLRPCLGTPSVPVVLSGDTGNTNVKMIDAPVVDPTEQTVLAFSSDNIDGTNTTSAGVVLQANTALGSTVAMGIGGLGGGSGVACNGSSVCAPIYAGAFDQAYFSSAIPSLAGHMYVCGKDPSLTDRPVIYQLSFNATTGALTGVGTPLLGLVDGSTEACSPVTEIYNSNTSKDLIFFSIGNLANTTDPIPSSSNCRSTNQGCLISIDVTNASSWPPTDVTNAVSLTTPGVPGSSYTPSSSSGIVVDNISGSTQAANIYFSLGTNSVGTGPGLPSCNTTSGVGCAIKLTQSALQ